MSAEIQEQGMDVASFVNMLDIASSESAQRAEIPTGGVQQSMAAVQQVRHCQQRTIFLEISKHFSLI